MKAVHSEEYYSKYADVLFEKYKKECNYEYDLSILLPDFSMIPEEHRGEAMAVVVKMAARKVAEAATAELLKKLHTLSEIREGRASLGYISKNQEVTEWHDLNEGFEFSCWMLAQFKKKYGIV